MRSPRRQAQRRDALAPSHWRSVFKGVAVVLLVVTPLVGGLVQAGRWLLDPATFPVRSVKVEGSFRYLGRDALQAAVNTHVGQGLLWVDVEAVRREVERLAWVSHASVRRVWPHGLLVWVEEQQPFARWLPGGLVNTSGEVFAAPVNTGPQGLPAFSGPEGLSVTVTQRYREFLPVLGESDLSVQTIELDERGAWRVQLESGLVLDLGREDVTRRLARFARVYVGVLAKESRSLARVDLRYANGFAVEFAASTPEGGAAPVERQSGINKGDLADAKKV